MLNRIVDNTLFIVTTSHSGIDRRTLQKQENRGHLVRLFHGAYAPADEFAVLDSAGKYRARAKAFLLTHPNLRAWGITAAALRGAPVLSGAPLHFSGPRTIAQTRQEGCTFHKPLTDSLHSTDPVARILLESATSSPLPDALLAANHLLRQLTVNTTNKNVATLAVNDNIAEVLMRPLQKNAPLHSLQNDTYAIDDLDITKPKFIDEYRALLKTVFASSAAELSWFNYARLCKTLGTKIAFRKALWAGLFFSDQAESPAESLLTARCIELGFCLPHLQVNILNPTNMHFLGRVDGLWPSPPVAKGLYLSDGKYGRLLHSNQPGDSNCVVIEFDGKLKYRQNPTNVLEKERQRQNAISNLGFRFIRISWADLMEPERLRLILTTAGVPRYKRDYSLTRHRRQRNTE